MTDIRRWLGQQDALDRVERALTEAGLSGALSWTEVDRLASALGRDRPAEDTRDYDELYRDWIVECFKLKFTPAQLDSMPAALRLGARPEDLLILGVSGFSAEGQDLPLIAHSELERRVQAVLGLRESFGASPWLDGYTVRLRGEWQRRHGGGA